MQGIGVSTSYSWAAVGSTISGAHRQWYNPLARNTDTAARHTMPNRDLPTIIATLQKQMPYLSEKYAVQSLGIFGSYARNQQHIDSDLDLLVTFRQTPGLLAYLALENYLADLLGVRVDLVMASALKPAISARIRNEVISL
jgi:uncharacterized protein